MRKIFTIILLFYVCTSSAQHRLPSYPDVLKEFFKSYRFSSTENVEGITLAKKKSGWHAQIINRQTEDVLKDEIFWSATDGNYKHLEEFSPALPDVDADHSTAEFIENYTFSFYGYERCAYYGYNGWAADMIHDFGGGNLQNYTDTLLEGLARAYSAYASFFSWYQFGGKDLTGDSLKKKLLPLEKPSRQRVDSLDFYYTKAIGIFKLLAAKNPNYETIIGNSVMKVFNEQMYVWLLLSTAGYPELAEKYFNQISPNEANTRVARIYLQNAPPNSILFTYGDNDTFPLLYIQESQSYRKDVTVINTSLLGMPPYINLLADKGLRFSTPRSVYGDTLFTYVYRKGIGEGVSPLSEFLDNIQKKKDSLVYDGYGAITAYTESKLVLPVDRQSFSKISRGNYFLDSIEFEPRAYMLLYEYMMLDLINSNLYDRPLLFTGPETILLNYQMKVGPYFQFLPLDHSKGDQIKSNSVKEIQLFLSAGFQPIPERDQSTGITVTSIIDNMTFDLYGRVIKYYQEQAKNDSARIYVDKLVKGYDGKLPANWYNWDFFTSMIDAGYKQEGVRYLEALADGMVKEFEKPSAMRGFKSFSTVVNFITLIKSELEERNLKSDKIDLLSVRFK